MHVCAVIPQIFYCIIHSQTQVILYLCPVIPGLYLHGIWYLGLGVKDNTDIVPAHKSDHDAVYVFLGASVSVSFGERTGTIHITNVQCRGSETMLASCPRSTQSSDLSQCTHANDASVRCTPAGC